ncbi:MAG: phage tail tape measure protein [Oscillospiraceae bacterium]|nr:phage tail tape measure protein [Oscillospiraceae bacterium]
MARGSVRGIVIEIGGDTTKLETALKSVNTEIKNTESKLKDVNKLLKMDPGNTNLLSQKYKTLQTEIKATKEKLDTLKEAAKQADQALADGKMSKEQYDALQREIAETEQSLKSLEQEYKNFGSVQAQQIAAAGEKMKEFGGKVESAGKTLTTHVTLPLAAVGAAGVASFAEVDKTMQLTNKTMGNTEEQAQLLNKAMKDAAANSTFGMKDAATATLNFARAGLTAEEAAAALAPAMNLAAGEGGNLDTVSGGLVATINGFHGSFDEAGRYADVFAAACNNSALDVDSLSHAMSVAAPIFSSAGYTVNDAALYMGIMANNGIDADKAANSLKTGLARLVSPAKEGAEMMDKLGISVTNSDGTMKSSIQIQKELHDAFSKLSESEQIAAASAIFGKNQMAPWLALINTAPEEVGELDAALSSCAGTTDEMAEAMMSGFGGSLEKLKSSIDVLVTSIGEALAPTIQKVATFIQGLVDKFNALTPAQQETIAKIGLVVAALGPLLIVVGKVISSVGTIMTFAPKIVSGVQSVIGIGSKLMGGLQSLWGVIMANPIVLIVAAIAAAVAAFIYFWNTSEEFRNFWIGLWEAIKTAVSTVVQAIATFFTETVPAAFTSFVEFFQGLWEGVKEFFSGLWEGMKEIVSTAWEAIKNVVQLAVMAIGEFFSTALTVITLPFQFIWENCKEIITTAWEAIKGVVSTALEAIKTGISTAWEAVKTATSTAFEAVKTVATTIWSGIQSALAPIISGIQTAVSTAWSAIQTATSTVFNAVKSTASTVWSGIKSAVSTAVDGAKSVVSTGWSAIQSTTTTVFNAVKSAASTAWNGIKTTVTTVVGNMKTSITTGLNGIKSAASTALNALKSTFTNVFNGVWSFVQGIVGKLKSIFNFSWSLPHIKLPHFSISGSFSLNPPSIPHFSVQWYKKAMNNGMILNSPTIFGASGSRLLGGGEAGPEAVVGVSSLMDMIQSAVSNTQLASDTGNITIPVYIGGNLIDEMIVTAQQRRALRSGGRA